MARRRRRRKSSYEQQRSVAHGSDAIAMDELSPRARRLVESGLIDLDAIVGSGEGGKLTSGDILHAARLIEVEQSVARIEATQPSNNGDQDPAPGLELPVVEEELAVVEEEPAVVEEELAAVEEEPAVVEEELPAVEEPPAVEAQLPVAEEVPPVEEEPSVVEEEYEGEAIPPAADDGRPEEGEYLADSSGEDSGESVEEESESATFSAVDVGGEPIAVEPTPWEDYNGSTDGFSERAREGAEQSWGEAEAHLAAMAEQAAANVDEPPLPEPHIPAPGSSEYLPPTPMTPQATPADVPPVAESVPEPAADVVPEPVTVPESVPVPSGEYEQAPTSDGADAPTEVMMDFGTLELVDPESVWAQGAEDFAPWFLAHSQQLGDVLGLQHGLSEARQFTTKSATGVLGRDDNGEDVVVVSSKSAIADDSDLGRALGMAASSGAASVALVSATLHEDQLKALAWLNNQTRSGVKWYGIEMKVVRIADSPAAMLFDLVASPPPAASQQVAG